MGSNLHLYHTWRKQLHQLAPDPCESRLTNLVLLVVGLDLAQSVHLTLIARKLPIRAQKLSLDKRLRRFLANGAVRVREWYKPRAVELLQTASRAGQVHLIMTKGYPTWRRLDSFELCPGATMWIGHAILTQASPYPTHLLLHWRKGEKEPWFLATNLVTPCAILRLYRRRMWIEEMFGDMKGPGFDLEASRLRHFLRLSRLTLAGCLVYLWLVALGDHVLRAHLLALVVRSDRRDLSVFRLGWDFLERCLALADPFPDLFIPNFCSVSGS